VALIVLLPRMSPRWKMPLVSSGVLLAAAVGFSRLVLTLVGFENHSGQTTLLPDQQPLGQVIKGWGNNEHSRREGAITYNAIGTYLHGPILPKNPAMTDHLILCALRRRNLAEQLAPLNDDLETAAAAAASRRQPKMSNDLTTARSLQ